MAAQNETPKWRTNKLGYPPSQQQSPPRFLGNQGSQPKALFATIRGIDPKYEYEPPISQSQNLALHKLEPIVKKTTKLQQGEVGGKGKGHSVLRPNVWSNSTIS